MKRNAQIRCAERRKAAGLIAYETASYRRMRLEVLTHYSGGGTPKCACCGEAHIEFLVLDHINGGGVKHRAAIKGRHRAIYRELRMLGFPAGYRVLCHNCNASLGLYGHCPHSDPGATTDRWLGKTDGPLAKLKATRNEQVRHQ